MDEQQLSDCLSFLNDSSSSSKTEDLLDRRLELGHGVHNWVQSGNNGEAHLHRRSYSASEVCFESEEPGLGTGYKPCLYFARGFCKNGSNCKFVHGGFADSVDGPPGHSVGSPSKFEELELHEEMMRLKAAQQQRLAAQQFLAGVSSPQSAYNKYMNFLLQQQNEPQRYTGDDPFFFEPSLRVCNVNIIDFEFILVLNDTLQITHFGFQLCLCLTKRVIDL